MPRHASSARAKYKNEQMIRQMAIATALLGINDLGRPVTPTFLFKNRFYLPINCYFAKPSEPQPVDFDYLLRMASQLE